MHIYAYIYICLKCDNNEVIRWLSGAGVLNRKKQEAMPQRGGGIKVVFTLNSLMGSL